MVLQADEGSPEELAAKVRAWLAENNIQVLNVAGQRDEKAPRIYVATVGVLRAVFGTGRLQNLARGKDGVHLFG